jgi:hypothetical protein
MSDLYVRRQIREWMNDPAMEIPYYDTVNAATNPLDDIWVTAYFNSISREKLTYCEGSWLEDGDVSIIYNGLPGVGDEAIFMAAEKDINTFMSQRDATRQLVITSRSAINDFSGGSTNQAYQIEIIVSYEFQEK